MKRHTRARRRPPSARRTAAHLLAAALASLLAPVMTAAPASADASSASFTAPGAYTWVVPSRVTFLSVDAAGGAGGGGHPGNGGEVRALLPVRPGATLVVVVGGQGSTSTGAGGYGGDGTWPNRAGGDHATTYNSGGGGGGTTLADALHRDLVVAGGGGGSGLFAPVYCGGAGGGAGAANGSDGCPGARWSGPDDSNGKGATATAPGTGGQCVLYSDGGAGDSNWGSPATGQGGNGVLGGGGGGGRHGGGGGCYDGNLGGGGGGGSSYGPAGAVFGVAASAGDGSVTLTPVPLGVRPLRPSDHCRTGTIVDGLSGGVYTLLKAQDDGATNGDAWVCFRVDGGGVRKGGWLDVNPAGSLPGAGGGGGGITNDSHSDYCRTPPAGYGANTAPGPHPFADDHTGDPGLLRYARAVFDIYTGTYTDPVTRARHDEAWACLTVTAGGATDGYRVVVNQAPPSVSVSSGTVLTFYPDPGTP